jgi:predicted enzyme related to lactoylglutathione lyase
MGQAVVHFEVIGKDGEKLREYYSQLFDWQIDASNPMNYGVVQRDGNTNSDGVGIGGGHVTFYVEVPDVEAALAKAESLGGERVMGPETLSEAGGMVLGQLKDPEGHVIGLIQSSS